MEILYAGLGLAVVGPIIIGLLLLRATGGTAIRRVQRGVDVLDQRYGSAWPDHVDLARLDMRHIHNCILGQLFGHYKTGRVALGLRRGARHGFDGVNVTDYHELADEWRRIIVARRVARVDA